MPNKVELNTLTQVVHKERAFLVALNENFLRLQQAINDTLSRSGVVPNQMEEVLDMNGKRIINVGAAVEETDALTKETISGLIAEVEAAVAQLDTIVAEAKREIQRYAEENIYPRAEQAVEDAQAASTAAQGYAQSAAQSASDTQDLYNQLEVLKDNIATLLAIGEDLTNINAVARNASNINTVATNIQDVNAVADSLDDLQTIISNLSDIESVLANISNINTVAGISSDVSSVAGIASEVSTVADISSDIQAVEDISSSIQTVSNIAAAVASVGEISSDVSTVAVISSDVSTVSSNAVAVANVSDNMQAVVSAVNYATEAKVWAEGTDAQVETYGGEKSSKGWAERAEEIVESLGHVMRYKGSVATYSDLPSSGQEIGDMYNVLDTGANYAWTGTAWDEVSGVVDLSPYRTAQDQDTIDAGKVPYTGATQTVDLNSQDLKNVNSLAVGTVNATNVLINGQPIPVEIDANVQYISGGGGTETVDLSSLYVDSQGATYGFSYDSVSSTIKNDNQGTNASFAYGYIELNLENAGDITISFSQDSEQGYDFGEISELDEYLTQDNQEDTDYAAWSGKEYGSVFDSITFSNVTTGYHFFTIKYIKDISAATGSDTFEITGIEISGGSAGSLIDTDTQEEIPLSHLNDMPQALQAIRDEIPDTSNFVTLNTKQMITAPKAITGTDVPWGSDQVQKNLFMAVSDSNTTPVVEWIGRSMLGANNLTFLMGTINRMAALGAHSWTSAKEGTGAAWADIYINPDGDKAVKIGGSPMVGRPSLMVIQNMGQTTTGTVKINRRPLLTQSALYKDVACWDDNVSKFNNDAGYITYADIPTTYIHEQGTASATWTINHNLHKFPSVSIVDSAGNEIIAEVSYPDQNTCVVTMSGASKGKAYLN